MIKEICLKDALERYQSGEDVNVWMDREGQIAVAPISVVLGDLRFVIDDDSEVGEEQKKSNRGRKRKDIDMGKVKALKDAGWSINDIAKEFNVGWNVIRDRMREEGYEV
jgi:hypothetical protein